MGRIIIPKAFNGINTSKIEVEGYYRLTTSKDGEITKDTGWFRNLITDYGLVSLYNTGSTNAPNGFGEPFGNCHVGTGNTIPATSDTALVSEVAAVDGSNTSNVYVPAAAPAPAYWVMTYSYQFGTGVAAGNLSEVGVSPRVGWSPSRTGLTSRALIVDSNGNPTTITVLSNEILTVTYQCRFYIDTSDHAFTFNLNGSPITGVYRAANIVTAPILQWEYKLNANNEGGITVYSSDIGSVNTLPTGSLGFVTINDIHNFVNDIANTGTCYCDTSDTLGINSGNGTIKSISITRRIWNFQFGNFSSPIIKTTGQQLQINMRMSWGRH